MDVLTLADFDGVRLRRDGVWVVNFTADWCGFSRRFLPAFERFAQGVRYRTAIGDLSDVDSGLWERFDIDVSPTLVVFSAGRPVFRRNGRLGYGLDDSDLNAVGAAAAAAAASGPTGP